MARQRSRIPPLNSIGSASRASPLLMLLATSVPVEPLSNSLTFPSGKVKWIFGILVSTFGVTDFRKLAGDARRQSLKEVPFCGLYRTRTYDLYHVKVAL